MKHLRQRTCLRQQSKNVLQERNYSNALRKRKLGRQLLMDHPTPTEDGIAPASGVFAQFIHWRNTLIAVLSLGAILIYLWLRFYTGTSVQSATPVLWVALALGGVPLVIELSIRLLKKEFGSDLLAGISIVTAILLGEYLAGTLVVLMLSGGEALEAYAVRRASSVLTALAKRMPSRAHRQTPSGLEEIPIADVAIGDILQIFPHAICPVDGTVVEGRGTMDEAYLTGEPYRVPKSIGSEVLSGAINGEAVLAVRATRQAIDSRYARIVEVMKHSQQQRPQMRRLGDQLGAWYTPLALSIAGLAWFFSGEAIRFLAVLVVATPCPLLIAIPVTIIGSISLAARRNIIIRDPLVLEQISKCTAIIFDKTGTLTYGKPSLVEQHLAPEYQQEKVLQLAASIEQYSRHPLAQALVNEAKAEKLSLVEVGSVEEKPGQGLRGIVSERSIQITSRKKLLAAQPEASALLPETKSGLECVIMIDDRYAATYIFRDEPRKEGLDFIRHLSPMHDFKKVVLLSGDRASEVEYLATLLGIKDVHSGKSPEEKLEIVRSMTKNDTTAFVGDGINDAPAMLAATVGIAMGQANEVTTESAGAVVMDNQLARVDELLHIATRMRRIALQSAVGGMALSVGGMGFAAFGFLTPVAGAVAQELIDVVAVLNALRAAWAPKTLRDFNELDES